MLLRDTEHGSGDTEHRPGDTEHDSGDAEQRLRDAEMPLRHTRTLDPSRPVDQLRKGAWLSRRFTLSTISNAPEPKSSVSSPKAFGVRKSAFP